MTVLVYIRSQGYGRFRGFSPWYQSIDHLMPHQVSILMTNKQGYNDNFGDNRLVKVEKVACLELSQERLT